MKGSKKRHASPRRKKSCVSLTKVHGKNSATSARSVSSMSQMKMQVFREAFNVIDQDGDGTISKDDLVNLYASLNVPKKGSEIDEMLKEASGPLNATKFSCMLASRAGDIDDSQVLLNAFAILDTEGRGMIPIREFCTKMSSVGFSRMTPQEINAILRIAPVDANGYLDYKQFVQMIRGESRGH